MACVSPDVLERPKEHYKTYHAFCDPSGGSSDSFTLAIGHKDIASKVMIVDAIRECKPPFSPEAVCAEFARICKSYNITRIVGDRYAGTWPVEQFGKFGITYEQSAKPKSELYLDLLAAINSRRVALLDHGKLINQLIGLERRTARSGRESIEHAPGAHDDVCNAVAGLCAGAINKYGNYDASYRAFSPDYKDPDTEKTSSPPQPEQPLQANEHWWKGVKRAPSMGNADDRLSEMYQGFNNAIRWGQIK
jgi:hypothetical protein